MTLKCFRLAFYSRWRWRSWRASLCTFDWSSCPPRCLHTYSPSSTKTWRWTSWGLKISTPHVCAYILLFNICKWFKSRCLPFSLLNLWTPFFTVSQAMNSRLRLVEATRQALNPCEMVKLMLGERLHLGGLSTWAPMLRGIFRSTATARGGERRRSWFTCFRPSGRWWRPLQTSSTRCLECNEVTAIEWSHL